MYLCQGYSQFVWTHQMRCTAAWRSVLQDQLRKSNNLELLFRRTPRLQENCIDFSRKPPMFRASPAQSDDPKVLPREGSLMCCHLVRVGATSQKPPCARAWAVREAPPPLALGPNQAAGGLVASCLAFGARLARWCGPQGATPQAGLGGSGRGPGGG